MSLTLSTKFDTSHSFVTQVAHYWFE